MRQHLQRGQRVLQQRVGLQVDQQEEELVCRNRQRLSRLCRAQVGELALATLEGVVAVKPELVLLEGGNKRVELLHSKASQRQKLGRVLDDMLVVHS